MRFVKVGLIVIASIGLLWTAVLAGLQWQLHSAISSNLATFPGTVETHSTTQSNAAAIRIANASTALGLPLKTREEGPMMVGPEHDAVVRAHLSQWLSEQSETTEPGIAPLTDELVAFLTSQADGLRALDQAVDSGEPVWAFEPELDGPIPNLLAHLSVVRLYAVRALEAERNARHDEAWQHLHRAFDLARALAARPQSICSIIALEEHAVIARTSLQLSSEHPPWFDEFLEVDPVQSFIRSLGFETRLAGQNLFDSEAVLAAENPTLFTLAGQVLLHPRVIYEVTRSIENDRPLAQSITRNHGCSFGPADTSPSHSVAVRIEAARREMDLARLVRDARAGRAPAPRSICGYAWRVAPRDGELHFSLPENAPRRNMGINVREFRLPVTAAVQQS